MQGQGSVSSNACDKIKVWKSKALEHWLRSSLEIVFSLCGPVWVLAPITTDADWFWGTHSIAGSQEDITGPERLPVLTNEYCFYRGPKYSALHPHQTAYDDLRDSSVLLWPQWPPALTGTYLQTHTHNFKNNKNKYFFKKDTVTLRTKLQCVPTMCYNCFNTLHLCCLLPWSPVMCN